MAGAGKRFSFAAAALERTQAGHQHSKQYSKRKQHAPRAPHRPCPIQQLAAQADELQALNASRVALKARLQATEEQLSLKTVQADTAAQGAAKLASQLDEVREMLAAAEGARSNAQNAYAQLKADAATDARNTRLLETRLHDTTLLLGANQQHSAAQQAQLSALQQALEHECKAHALTRERELQATAAAQAELQQRNRTTAALTASQQQLEASGAEAAVLRDQIGAAYKTLNKLQKSSTAQIAQLSKQLQLCRSQLCQQRQSTTAALTATSADKFASARLAAQHQTLQLQLARSVEQHQAAMAAAASSLQAVTAERDAAVMNHQAAQQRYSSTAATLAATQQELESASAGLHAAKGQLAAAHKHLSRCQQQAAFSTNALQTKLDIAAKQAQQQKEAAARAMVTPCAARFTAARLQAQQNSLEQQLMVVSGTQEKAMAAAADADSKLLQAVQEKAMLQKALAAQLDHNTSLQTALLATSQQLADSKSDMLHLCQQVSTAQRDLAALNLASTAKTAKLKHQLSTAQSSQQQQRDTSARYGAAAAAARFECARLQAQAATLRSQLADALQQHAAATASAASTITALQQAQQQAATEQQALKQLLVTEQHHHHSTQQELRLGQASLATCMQRLAVASKALLKLQQVSAAQLRETTMDMQQQREAGARFAAEAGACRFMAARHAAARRSLQEQLAAAETQHAAAIATAAATITALKHTAEEAAAETCAAQQLLHNSCASTQQQLEDATQHNMALQQEVIKNKKALCSKGKTGPSSTAALQQQLSACQVRMQQQREAAAGAHARAQAAEWRAAKQEAAHKHSQKQHKAMVTAAAIGAISVSMQLLTQLARRSALPAVQAADQKRSLLSCSFRSDDSCRCADTLNVPDSSSDVSKSIDDRPHPYEQHPAVAGAAARPMQDSDVLVSSTGISSKREVHRSNRVCAVTALDSTTAAPADSSGCVRLFEASRRWGSGLETGRPSTSIKADSSCGCSYITDDSDDTSEVLFDAWGSADALDAE